jgi:hypothetical protein
VFSSAAETAAISAAGHFQLHWCPIISTSKTRLDETASSTACEPIQNRRRVGHGTLLLFSSTRGSLAVLRPRCREGCDPNRPAWLASCRHRAPTKIDVLRPQVPAFIQHRPTDTKYHEDRCRFSTVKSSLNMANNRQYYTSSGWQQDVPIHHQQNDEANRQYYPPSPWQQEIAVPSYNEDEGYRQGEGSRGFQGKLIFAFIIPFKQLETSKRG